MATTKKRVDITLSPETEKKIECLAERDDVPVARKVARLLETALEIEEDEALEKLAKERYTEKISFISHKRVWE